MRKFISCKIGTIPSLVELHKEDKLIIGKWVRVIEKGENNYIEVFVNKILEDGYFQADR